MKLTTLAGLLALALSATPLHAQDVLKPANIQRYYTPVRLFLQGAAIVMPEEKYTFKIDPGQMDFGQWINHATERNYVDCAILKGEPNPMPKAKVDLLKTKAEIVDTCRSRSSTAMRPSPASTTGRSCRRRR
ncbi:MAG: hypothetical protein R2708_08760 [Vicinamibacterales bacterium]